MIFEMVLVRNTNIIISYNVNMMLKLVLQ